jgi:hypothetical protein
MIAIPRVRAQTFIRKMTYDGSQSCLFACHTGEEQYQDYVVKFRRQLGAQLVPEFIAALLGQRLGLPVPSIAIVEIDSRLVEAIPDVELRQRLAGDQGPHFGSVHKSCGYMPWPHGLAIPTDLMPQALDIFAFDLLVQNPSRSNTPGHETPNLLFDGHDFLIFGHEQAFSLARGLSASSPWRLRGSSLVENHIFYRPLVAYAEKQEISFETFLDRWMAGSEAFLAEIKKAIPVSWHESAEVDNIIRYLTAVRENIERFRRGLLAVFV